jgi:hypothetical protein
MTNRAPRVCGRVGALRLDAFASIVDIGVTGGTLSGFSLTFLTRSECHLCAAAEPIVRRVATEFGAAVSVVDIDGDPELQGRYATRVPVVLGPVDRVVAEGVIDEDDLRRALTADLGRLG